jgi:delta 1-pyrroline-5-carboxylate dehydrogenase
MSTAISSPATPENKSLHIETRLFINGEFVDAAEGGRISVLNPHDNSLIAEVSEARTVDIDRAVGAARKAFPAWKRMAAADRGRLLVKLAEAIEVDIDYLALTFHALPPRSGISAEGRIRLKGELFLWSRAS